MILLWGVAEDRPLTLVRKALEKRGVPCFFLDQARAPETRFETQIAEGVSGVCQIGGKTCDLASVTAVYVRCYDSRAALPSSAPSPETMRHAAELDEAVAGWLDATLARVVNPFSAMASNSSKPYQLALIAKSGFATPDTFVSTDAQAVKAFWREHGEIVYKSVSGVRSVVSRLKPQDADRLDRLRWCPTQFQQYVAGRDYRVHVVGEEVFATEILSDADDYRYAESQGTTPAELRGYALPADCAARCRHLAHSLGLPVAGVDLRRTPQGEWFCFEVNPSPAFSYYEAATDQPISGAIAALLAGE